MDYGSNDPENRGRLGRERQETGGREHPPEQYPGSRGPDNRSDYGDRDDYGNRSRTEGQYGGSPEPNRGRGWGIAALVLAILSFIAAFFIAFLNLVLAIPALIVGIVARRKGSRGLGLAAIIISILAILLGIIVTLAVGAFILNSPEFQQILQEAQQQ